MMDTVGSGVGVFATVALLASSVTLSALVMFGALVPRWVYRKTAAERDRYRDDAYACSQAVAVSQAQQQQLLDELIHRRNTSVDHRKIGD